MESIWLEYAWALLILIGLEGLLSADNALVLAVIAKHLPEEQKKRAINYGIIMAFVFRFAALFAISFIANVWQIQAIGAAYLLYLGLKHVIQARFGKKNENIHKDDEKEAAGKGFWPTVGKIALADLAFAIDSISSCSCSCPWSSRFTARRFRRYGWRTVYCCSSWRYCWPYLD